MTENTSKLNISIKKKRKILNPDYLKYLLIDLKSSNFATFVDTDGTVSIIDCKYTKISQPMV
jgi:hypothetical protein